MGSARPSPLSPAVVLLSAALGAVVCAPACTRPAAAGAISEAVLASAAGPQAGAATAAAAAAASALPAVAYAYRENQNVVALVEKARAEIAKRGEAAFADFRRKGSEWLDGDRYVFVWDLKGNSYVYPPDQSHEGQNDLAMEDINGKPIGRMLVERAASPQGQGWVHYQWLRPVPNSRRPVWKSSYVMRVTAPSGKTYLVGSGSYEGRVEKAFVVDEVKAAAALLRRKGRAAFAELRDRKGRFYFHETYIFVDTPSGVEVVNPAFPELEGRNIMGLRDASGKPMVKDYIRLALERGSGWTTYLWPQPERSRLPLEKHTYVERVVTPQGETLIVGSGIYEP